MKKGLMIIAGILVVKLGIAQTLTADQYIEQNKDYAIREMKRMGIPAAITLAQGILETESGNSDLVKKSNNHFGIKCKSSWTSGGVSHDDDAPGECFRSYKNAEESYRDHSNFLRGSERYAFLFKLDPKDYKGWAYGLRKAGYATNPRYPQILIKYIEQNNLEQYTMLAINEVPVFDASKYTSDPEVKVVEDDLEIITEKAIGKITKNKEQPDLSIEFENKTVINGSTAVLAKKGTSLLAIATDNNINLSRLLEYNELEKDGLLEKDQVIFLEKKSKEGEKDFYIVQPGEALYDVAQKNGVRLQSLYEYNAFLKGETPASGTRINLKPREESSLALESSVALNDKVALNDEAITAAAKLHEVQPKEGLYSISKRYGITVSQIKEWNNLPGDNLKVGQQLIISISK